MGRGKLSFHGKREFSPPISHPFQRKARYFAAPLSQQDDVSQMVLYTLALRAARLAGAKKNSPSGVIKTTTRLSGKQPDDRRNSQRPRGVIAPLSGSFAKEKPGERTCVRDPDFECGKACGSKRERPAYYYYISMPPSTLMH